MGFQIQLNGLKKRISDMEEMAGYRAMDMVNELTGIGEAQAKALAPVDYGELRESIHMTAARITDEGIVEGSFGTNCDHAIFMEYGTGQKGIAGIVTNGQEKDPEDVAHREDWPGVPAQPYMYPATKLVMEASADIHEKYKKKFIEGK